MQSYWFLSKVFTHLRNLSYIEIGNEWSTESSAFSISIVANKSFNFNVSFISDKSEINLPPSLINRPSTYAVWFEWIKKEESFLDVEPLLLKELSGI